MATELDFDSLPAQIQALATVVGKLETPAALDIPDDLQPTSFGDLETAAKQVDELLDDSIQPALDALDAELESMQSAVDKATQLANDAQTIVETKAVMLDQAVDAFDLRVDEECDEIRTLAEEKYTELSQWLEGLHNATQALVAKAKEFGDSFPERSGAFVSRIGNEALSKIEAQTSDSAEDFQSALNEVSTQLRASSNALDAQLKSQLGRLDQAATSGISNHIESAGQRIVQGALRQVANAVAGSIAQMTVGVQLTSTMSPILPQMIVLNKSADALLELIEVYKKLKMGML